VLGGKGFAGASSPDIPNRWPFPTLMEGAKASIRLPLVGGRKRFTWGLMKAGGWGKGGVLAENMQVWIVKHGNTSHQQPKTKPKTGNKECTWLVIGFVGTSIQREIIRRG